MGLRGKLRNVAMYACLALASLIGGCEGESGLEKKVNLQSQGTTIREDLYRGIGKDSLVLFVLEDIFDKDFDLDPYKHDFRLIYPDPEIKLGVYLADLDKLKKEGFDEGLVEKIKKGVITVHNVRAEYKINFFTDFNIVENTEKYKHRVRDYTHIFGAFSESQIERMRNSYEDRKTKIINYGGRLWKSRSVHLGEYVRMSKEEREKSKR